MSDLPVINLQPSNKKFNEGQTISFTAGAVGGGIVNLNIGELTNLSIIQLVDLSIEQLSIITVQWQVSIDGGISFNDILGETYTTYTFVAHITDDNNQYRAIFTNSEGSTATNVAYLTMNEIEAPLNKWMSSIITCLNASEICKGFNCKAKNYPQTKIKYIVVKGAIIAPITICSQPELQKYLV